MVYNSGYPQRKFFATANSGARSKEISAAMAQKKADIMEFTDKKDQSIKLSQATSAALELCNILVEKGNITLNPTKDDLLGDYREYFKQFMWEIFEMVVMTQEEVREYIQNEYLKAQEAPINKKARKVEVKESSLSQAEHDIASDIANSGEPLID